MKFFWYGVLWCTVLSAIGWWYCLPIPIMYCIIRGVTFEVKKLLADFVVPEHIHR